MWVRKTCNSWILALCWWSEGKLFFVIYNNRHYHNPKVRRLSFLKNWQRIKFHKDLEFWSLPYIFIVCYVVTWATFIFYPNWQCTVNPLPILSVLTLFRFTIQFVQVFNYYSSVPSDCIETSIPVEVITYKDWGPLQSPAPPQDWRSQISFMYDRIRECAACSRGMMAVCLIIILTYTQMALLFYEAFSAPKLNSLYRHMS